MPKQIMPREFLKDLRRFITLPSNITDLVIRLGVNKLVEVQCTFYPEVPAEIGVTKLHSVAMEYELDPTPITKRYNLVEIEEPAAPHVVGWTA